MLLRHCLRYGVADGFIQIAKQFFLAGILE